MSKPKSLRIPKPIWFSVAAVAIVALWVFLSDGFSSHPRVQLQVKSLPSVNEAVLQAIDLSTPLQVFGDGHQMKFMSSPAEVMIVAIKKADSSIKVMFRIAPDTNGQLYTTPLFEVVFTVSDKASIQWASRDLENQRVDPKSAAVSQALLAVFSDDKHDTNENEYTTVVSVKEKYKDGFSVHQTRYPYLPGGHCTYELSKDFKIIGFHPGA